MVLEATFKGIQQRKSKHGGTFFYLFFEDKKGNALKVMAYPKLKNFINWLPFLTLTRGAIVGNLKLLKGYDNVINGNCKPIILKEVKINQIKMNFEKENNNNIKTKSKAR
tara:strand:- start:169 stop:498 length:330 start_codon:yes stop_codon:yes gene_type:complete